MRLNNFTDNLLTKIKFNVNVNIMTQTLYAQ